MPAEKQPDLKIDASLNNPEAFSIQTREEDADCRRRAGRRALRRGAMAFAAAGRGYVRRGKAGFRAPRHGAVLNERRILRLPTHAAGVPLVLRPPAVDPVPRLPASQPLQHDFPLERPHVPQHRVDAGVSGRHRPDARGVGPQPGAVPLVHRRVRQAEHPRADALLPNPPSQVVGEIPQDSDALQQAQRFCEEVRSLCLGPVPVGVPFGRALRLPRRGVGPAVYGASGFAT